MSLSYYLFKLKDEEEKEEEGEEEEWEEMIFFSWSSFMSCCALCRTADHAID